MGVRIGTNKTRLKLCTRNFCLVVPIWKLAIKLKWILIFQSASRRNKMSKHTKQFQPQTFSALQRSNAYTSLLSPSVWTESTAFHSQSYGTCNYCNYFNLKKKKRKARAIFIASCKFVSNPHLLLIII